jgi:hypothetical protein
MSRREIVVNTLLGILLITVWALPFLLALAAAAYLVGPMNRLVKLVFPTIHDPANMLFFCLFGAMLLVGGICLMRKRRWMNAFLSFASAPMLLSIWLADSHSPLGLNGSFWFVAILPLLAIPADSDSARPQFFLVASTIGAVIAVNTGLFGSGPVARISADIVTAALLVWFVIDTRQYWSSSDSPVEQVPPSPVSPTRA